MLAPVCWAFVLVRTSINAQQPELKWERKSTKHTRPYTQTYPNQTSKQTDKKLRQKEKIELRNSVVKRILLDLCRKQVHVTDKNCCGENRKKSTFSSIHCDFL